MDKTQYQSVGKRAEKSGDETRKGEFVGE